MENKKKLQFKNVSPNPDPTYANPGDSGFDLRAWLVEGQITLKPLERRLIPTGLYFDIPHLTEIQFRPRSGCAYKMGLSLVNTPSTIDEKFIGECKLLVINLSNEDIIIEHGDRIAQGVLCPVFNSYGTDLVKVDIIEKESERGSGGFGSTGLK